MTTEGRDDKEGMDPQDDAALWALLGRQTPPAQPSPYFSRRVLRDVTLAQPSRAAGWWTGLRRVFPPTFSRRTAVWSGVFSGGCALGLFCLSNGAQLPRTVPPPRGEAAVVASQSSLTGTPLAAAGTEMTPRDSVPVEEVEVIADLDNILQREESRLWTDDTVRF